MQGLPRITGSWGSFDQLCKCPHPSRRPAPALSDFSVFLASCRLAVSRRQGPSVVLEPSGGTCFFNVLRAQRWTEGPEAHEGLRVSAGQRARGPPSKGLAAPCCEPRCWDVGFCGGESKSQPPKPRTCGVC